MRISKFYLFALFVVLVIIGVFIVNFFLSEDEGEVDECFGVAGAGFVYDVCYDSYTYNVFMLVKGGDFSFDSFGVSFFDGENRDYDLSYDDRDDSQLYKVHAERNPLMIRLDLGVVDVGCDSSKYLPVRYCETRRPGDGRGSLNGSEVEDYFELAPRRTEDYPGLDDYTEKEIAWSEVCKSDWNCSGWEDCDGDLQRRSCVDLNECEIPIGFPSSVRYCGAECIEKWDCEWGNCVGGFMEPVCRDLNSCGTEYDKPNAMNCDTRDTCQPDIFCDEWTSCNIDYSFLDLISKGVSGLMGSRSRVCRDRSGCVESRKEVLDCTVGVDIYVEEFEKCGEKFIGVYDELDDSLVARIREGIGEDFSLNIYFDDDVGYDC